MLTDYKTKLFKTTKLTVLVCTWVWIRVEYTASSETRGRPDQPGSHEMTANPRLGAE